MRGIKFIIEFLVTNSFCRMHQFDQDLLNTNYQNSTFEIDWKHVKDAFISLLGMNDCLPGTFSPLNFSST